MAISICKAVLEDSGHGHDVNVEVRSNDDQPEIVLKDAEDNAIYTIGVDLYQGTLRTVVYDATASDEPIIYKSFGDADTLLQSHDSSDLFC